MEETKETGAEDGRRRNEGIEGARRKERRRERERGREKERGGGKRVRERKEKV